MTSSALKVTVKAHHVSITSPLKTYAEKKITKLEKYFDHIQTITVDLVVNDTSAESERQVATLVAHVSGSILRAEQTSADMYASIDGAYEKLASQLKKYKDKLRSPKRTSTKKQPTPSSKETSAVASKKIKKSKLKSLVVTKPIAPEDAAAILTEKGVSFLVFRNLETHAINVIYPDADGFALIETE